MIFSIKQLAKITGAKILKSEIKEDLCFEISTDTRTINKNNVFLPIIGQNFDGHDFIEKALENGALGYFTSKEIVSDKAKFVLLVEDTLIAYLTLAKFYKDKINPKTIAITGSAGKTTTKEMAYSIFSQKYKTHKSALNHNNEIGLAQTLLSMPENTEVLIVEMGMRGLGEIELLSKYAEPDIAIISNIGSAHIGRLGSKENIAKAKFEITKYLKSDGILIANKNRYLEKINDIKNRTIEFSLASKDLEITKMVAGYSKFNYKGGKYRINLPGDYNIQNSLGVIEAALHLGLSENIIAKGLSSFRSIQNRWQIESVVGANIINDSYNANPESMMATIKNFLRLYKGRKILVLGDMGELGKDEVMFHKAIGKSIKNMNFDILLTVGNLSRNISDAVLEKSIHFPKTEGCIIYLKNNLKAGDWVFIKGSRSMELDKIVTSLKELRK